MIRRHDGHSLLPGSASLCLAACACVLAVGSCNDEPRRPAAPATARNVLLIVIDTLRADKLGCYGNKLGLSPNLDRFAADGFVFEQAFSHAPWTLPATASLLTSSIPQEHGAGGHISGPTALNEGAPLLSQCLFDQGYETSAIINVYFLSPKFGLNRGFQSYDYREPSKDQSIHRTATEVTDLAMEWLRSGRDADRPFFLLAHYFDPHLPYDPPAEYRKRFARPEDATLDPKLFGTVGDMKKFRDGLTDLSELPMDRLEALYNAEIAYTDHEVGRLLDSLEELGLRNNTIVAITADHGEEFLDHGGFEHGHTHYDELLHVPLVFYNPSEVARGRSSAVVRHMDVAPTLCELAGVNPHAKFRGESLAGVLARSKADDRDVLAEGNLWGTGARLKSLRRGGYKYIEKTGPDELYHVAADPKERHNLAASRQALCDEMSALIEQALQSARDRLSGVAPKVVTPSEREKKNLESVGYIAASEPDKIEPDAATSQPAGRVDRQSTDN